MEKKGLSEVIATTLLILLVVVIGVSIYLYSSNFLGNQKKELSSALNPNLALSIDDIVINQTGTLATLPASPSEPLEEQEIIITITRTDNEDKEIQGIRFIFTDKSGNNKIYNIMNPPAEAGIPKSYKITSTQLNLVSFSDIEKVSLSFILAEGTTPILAEKTLK